MIKISYKLINVFLLFIIVLSVPSEAATAKEAREIGYHTKYHDYGCTKGVCSTNNGGGIHEVGLGQWYESCGTCANKGRPNNDFLVKESSDQVYTCGHYPSGMKIVDMDGYHGVYRRGQCQYNFGWATLNTRVSSFSHDYYFCPGHRTPNAYQVQYNGNGGSGAMENSVHTYNESKRLTANQFIRPEYRFLGWAKTGESNQVVYQNGQEVTNLTPDNGAVITLYAVWELINPNPPTIQAQDIYIHQNDKDVVVGRDLLLSKAHAEDVEDGILTDKIIISNMQEVIRLSNEAFTQEELKHLEKVITVQYIVYDKGGKSASTEARLHIIPALQETRNGGYVRFIAPQFIDNIRSDSKWYQEQYKQKLRDIFNTPIDEIPRETL